MSIHDKFERGECRDSWLLGDSGYALKHRLIIPLTNPSTVQEQKFNSAHKKSQPLIERSFGILKSRWRIIDHT